MPATMDLEPNELPEGRVTSVTCELGKISKEQRSGEWDVWQASLANPNFSKFAENCGGVGIRVTEADELESAIRTALEIDGPNLVEIMSDALLV